MREEPPSFHRLAWRDFDALARFDGDAVAMRRLRRAERSRRKLLLHALRDESLKLPDLVGPLPSFDAAWDLLARAEAWSPTAFDRVLTHPYTGSWAGYTIRLLRNGITGQGPLWTYVGHLHALAVAAAVRAGLDFELAVPAWHGNVVLPSLGIARLTAPAQYSTAVVSAEGGRRTVATEHGAVRLPDRLDTDTADWWAVRRLRTRVGARRFTLRLDDLDPYRGLYEPVPPQRLPAGEVADWQRLIDQACQLIVVHLPDLAESMPVALQSIVPKPQVLFRNPSASTGEAFGSAVLGRPADGAELAATLVHEYQHIVLGGLLHLIRLYDTDPRERVYVPWRDDPRPFSGAVTGVYAFFGVTAFWRAVARSGELQDRAAFEFAYWRAQSWRTLRGLIDDPVLTDAGRRFLDGIADRLGPWQREPVARDVVDLAEAAARDHYAGWRVRHLRPERAVVERLADAWLAGLPRPPGVLERTTLPPTPIPDGGWSRARLDLVRLVASGLPTSWPAVPGATEADGAYASGRFAEAAARYRAALGADPDSAPALVGLGLALSACGPDPAGRAFLHRPELVRAVHRRLRGTAAHPPSPESIASWIGQVVSGGEGAYP